MALKNFKIRRERWRDIPQIWDDPEKRTKLFSKIEEFLSEERVKKISSVLEQRTTHFIPILENIYDLGNVNAIVRTAENLGFQKINIIRSNNVKQANRITRGSEKWVDINMWDSSADCIESIRSSGYQILTASLSAQAKAIHEFDFSRPTAIVFGNENVGPSEYVMNHSDQHLIIPTCGLSQSFNVSVAAGIILHWMYLWRLNKNPGIGRLDNEAVEQIKLDWFCRDIRQIDLFFNKILDQVLST